LDIKLVRRNNSRSVRIPLKWIPSWSEEITAEVSESPRLDIKLVRRNNSRSVRNPLKWIPSWSEEITAEVSEIPSIGYQAGQKK